MTKKRKKRIANEIREIIDLSMDALIEHTFGDLGKSRDFTPRPVPEKYKKYVVNYATTDTDICTCIIDYLVDRKYIQ